MICSCKDNNCNQVHKWSIREILQGFRDGL